MDSSSVLLAEGVAESEIAQILAYVKVCADALTMIDMLMVFFVVALLCVFCYKFLRIFF